MKKLVILTLCFFVSISVLYGGEIEKTFTFSSSDISFIHNNGYDIIKMSGNVSTGEIGKPSLPRLIYTFVIPPSAEIENVEVISRKEIPIPGRFFVSPSQPFYPLSQDKPEFVEPDEATYSSASPYPGDIIYSVTSGSKTGYRLCGITLCPVQYYPGERKLILCKSITIRLTYKEGVRDVDARTQEQLRQAFKGVKVVNPEDITSFSPPLMRLDEEIQYLIITEDDFVPYFEPLAEWKTRKGVPTAIRTISWIDANYTGYDMAEKVRNYEKEVYADSGLVWVLIGVDAEEPNWFGIISNDIVRGIEAPFCHSECLADLYFGDLDGTWDENGDFIFGDPEDDVDMYSDVYIGRASVDDTLQAISFVEKTLTYEKTPAGSYEQSILPVAASLFTASPYNWWGDVVCDSIANHVPADWYINKLYESEGDDLTMLPGIFNEGYGYFEFATHGNNKDIHYESNEVIMDTTDADNLTNAPRYSIGTSISCYIGWFCNESEWGDCLCEHFMNNPVGGTVAFIGNGGLGWGALGFTELGPSERLDLEFYKSFFDNNVYHIGTANASARDNYVPLALGTGNDAYYWRICIYEWNIFGDPNLPMRQKNTPDILSVSYSDPILTGSQDFIVTVEVDGSPIADALVCTMKGDEVYSHDYTDATGTVTLSINPVSAGIMDITVTAQDCLPFEGTACVSPTDIDEGDDLFPTVTEIIGNYPNPFNPKTIIRYSIKENSRVILEIYNIKGQKIKSLVNDMKNVGYHKVVWSGKDENGRSVSSGIYFYKMETDNFSEVKKAILLK